VEAIGERNNTGFVLGAVDFCSWGGDNEQGVASLVGVEIGLPENESSKSSAGQDSSSSAVGRGLTQARRRASC